MRREFIVRSLIDGIKRLEDPDEMKRFIRFYALNSSRFSPRNALLIYAQRPDAAYVLGSKQWNLLGRRVKKGEKPIKIFAPNDKRRDAIREVFAKNEPYTIPLSAYIRDVPDDEIEAKQAEHRAIVEKAVAEGKPVPALVLADYPDLAGKVFPLSGADERTRFHLSSVFDISQTEGPPVKVRLLMPAQQKIQVNLFSAMKDYAESKGLKVRISRHENPSIRSFYRSGERLISVDSRHEPMPMLYAFTHQVGHGLLQHETDCIIDGTKREETQTEVEADAYAFILHAVFGVPGNRPMWLSHMVTDKNALDMARTVDAITRSTVEFLDRIGNFTYQWKTLGAGD